MGADVAITGLGAVSALGVGVEPLLDGWAAGRSGIEEGLGDCRDFEPLDFLSRKEARRTDRFTQLAIGAAHEAIEQAGWLERLPCEPHRVGCVLGTGFGGLKSFLEQLEVFERRGDAAVSPFTVPLIMPNAAAGNVSMRYGLRGTGLAVVSACATGADAIGTATRMIQAGDLDAVVAGGSDATLEPLVLAAFSVIEALSPSGRCRPFDAERDGFVMGEGAGVVTLERATLAADRGAPALGAVAGYAATSDAYHVTAPDPDAHGAARAIGGALRDADLTPADVDYVNAHGTGTPMNDRAETAALLAALGARAREVPVSSLKSAVGHLMGAAGGIEVVATVAALRRGLLPATIGLDEPEPGLDLDFVRSAPRPLEAGARGDAVALSNAFGFGGHNSVLCLTVRPEGQAA